MPHAPRIFLKEFLKAPQTVASMIPSSGFLERRVVGLAEPDQARVVVELGPGTGGITRALLRALGPDSRLLAIERTGEFVASLQAIDDRRFSVVHDCASTIVRQLHAHGLDSADAVVSGIPFSTMPPALCDAIIAGIVEALGPGGRFVAYQFTRRVADYALPLMGTPAVQHEWMNLPPLRVFTWHVAGLPEAAGARRSA